MTSVGSTQGSFSSGGGTRIAPVYHKITRSTTQTPFTVNPSQSGHIFILQPSGSTIFLPPVKSAIGCSFTFIMGGVNIVNDWTLIFPTGTLYGSILQGNNGPLSTTKITLGSLIFFYGSLQGDAVYIECDGTAYYARCIGSSVDSFISS